MATKEMMGSVVRHLIQIEDHLRTSPDLRQLYDDARNARNFSRLYAHEVMLADHVRMDAYDRAIARHVREGQTVIDLGTGTGALAFFAALRQARKVYAIDHSDIIEHARRVAEASGLTNIQFEKVNSRAFSVPEKVDVIIHEQIGNDIFEEHMVPNLLDLRDRLLKKGGRILPNRFEVYLEPVKLHDNYRVPFIWDFQLKGLDYSVLREVQPTLPRIYYRRLMRPYEVECLLCEPQAVMSFDLETLAHWELPKTIQWTRTVKKGGMMDGFCMYFKAFFDDEIVLSTFPLGMKTCWLLPLLRIAPREYKTGEPMHFHLTIGSAADVDTWTWTCT